MKVMLLFPKFMQCTEEIEAEKRKIEAEAMIEVEAKTEIEVKAETEIEAEAEIGTELEVER